jgi:hypothetical protein
MFPDFLATTVSSGHSAVGSPSCEGASTLSSYSITSQFLGPSVSLRSVAIASEAIGVYEGERGLTRPFKYRNEASVPQSSLVEEIRLPSCV